MNGTALAADSLAIIMLRSALALPDSSGGRPLEYGEWSRLAAALKASSWRRPGALIGKTPAAIAHTLDYADVEAERFAALLARHAGLMVELDRLATLGIRALTRVEPEYPARLKHRLGTRAPAVLFVAGSPACFDERTLAVTGSRDIDGAGAAFARALGELSAAAGVIVVSGAARGADREAMNAALAAEGRAVGVLADGLERHAAEREAAELLREGRLTLLSPYLPSAGFEAAQAHGRNRLIYCLGDVAVVVSSDANRGGTWSGAAEALRERWTPLFVRDAPDAPPGNEALLRRGANPLAPSLLADQPDIHAALLERLVGMADPEHGHGETAAPDGGGTNAHTVQLQTVGVAATPVNVEQDRGGQPKPAPLSRDAARDDSPEAGRPVDLFDMAWPLIAAYLRRPHPAREVAEAFGLEPVQAQRWLRRAAEQGLAELVGRTSGYRAVTAARPATVQPALL